MIIQPAYNHFINILNFINIFLSHMYFLTNPSSRFGSKTVEQSGGRDKSCPTVARDQCQEGWDLLVELVLINLNLNLLNTNPLTAWVRKVLLYYNK